MKLPSPATAISLVALIVALGGTSYAAITIRSGNVANGTLRSIDVKNNTLKSVDVRNRSLRRVDFAAGVLTAGQQGPAGPAGPKGDTGPPGAKGDPGDPAADAGTVGGQTITKLLYRSEVTADEAPLFSAGGLILTVLCGASTTSVYARTTKPDSGIYSVTTDNVSTSEDHEAYGDFQTADEFFPIVTGGGEASLTHFQYEAVDGSVVSGLFSSSRDGPSKCSITGHAVTG